MDSTQPVAPARFLEGKERQMVIGLAFGAFGLGLFLGTKLGSPSLPPAIRALPVPGPPAPCSDCEKNRARAETAIANFEGLRGELDRRIELDEDATVESPSRPFSPYDGTDAAL